MADKTIGDLTLKSAFADDDEFEVQTSAGNSRRMAGGSLPGRRVLSEHYFTGSDSTFTTPTLPTGYDSLEIEILARSSVNAANASCGMRFNGDTGANYRYQRVGATNTSGANTGTVTGTSIPVDVAPGNNATPPANTPGMAWLRLMDHESSTFTKAGIGNVSTTLGTTLGTYYAFAVGFWWLNTAPITTVTFFETGGNNFVVGSVIRVWGIK